MLYFFCFNVAFSKPEMYYCIEEGGTGFEADGKGGYNHTQWNTMKFKAKIDFDNGSFDSDDMWINAECSSKAGEMNCFDKNRARAIKIQALARDRYKLKFSYAVLGFFLNSDRTQLKISYGNCEKF